LFIKDNIPDDGGFAGDAGGGCSFSFALVAYSSSPRLLNINVNLLLE
jgi:hypothetical protein